MRFIARSNEQETFLTRLMEANARTPDLLQFNQALSDMLGRPTYWWREDQYWPRVADPHRGSKHVYFFGGSKIRMFEKLDWRGVRTVYTIGAHGSNQVRQLAAYCALERPNVRVVAATAPDDPHGLDALRARCPSAAANADRNERIARELGASVFSAAQLGLPAAGMDARTALVAWLEQQSKGDGAMAIPRGVACKRGADAWREMGEGLRLQFQQASGVDVVVVSGSGSTHLGIHAGIDGAARVIGLSTTQNVQSQTRKLEIAAANYGYSLAAPIEVDDDFTALYGGATPESHAALLAYRGMVDFDACPWFCGRIFQWLRAGKHRAQNGPLILVCTGLSAPASPTDAVVRNFRRAMSQMPTRG